MNQIKIMSRTRFAAKNKQTGALKHNLFAIFLSVIALSVLVWFSLPSSFSTDLSQIGQGKPAVAIIYDAEDGRSQHLLESFDQIREAYEDQVLFIVADLVAPKGRKFAHAQARMSVSTHFFSSEGKKLFILDGTHEPDALKKALNQAYGI